MKKAILFAFVAMMSLPAFADDIRLFGFVNVDNNSSTTVTDQNGNTDVNSFSWESSFVIGWNETTQQQVVGRVAGCDHGLGLHGFHTSTLIFRMAKDSHKYSSSWS